jgi:hypothetical protein
VHGRESHTQYNNSSDFGIARLCRSPSSSSRASSRKLTPESDSSQDSIPASLPAATARLRIKPNSPSMEQISSSSSGLSKRPATDEPSDTKHRKRSERCKGSSVPKNNRQHKTCKDDCSPRITCRPHDSWRNLRAHEHRRLTTSPQPLTQDEVDINLAKRHDTRMGNFSPPQKLPQMSKSSTKQDEVFIKQDETSIKQG